MSTEIYDEFFKRFGETYGIPWELLKAQAQAESSFNPNAIGAHGEEGIAQFMPATFHEWAQKLGLADASPFDPQAAIAVQAGYMAHLHERFGDWQKALAAYNWGMGHLAHVADDPQWQARLPDETLHYVARIIAAVRGLCGTA